MEKNDDTSHKSRTSVISIERLFRKVSSSSRSELNTSAAWGTTRSDPLWLSQKHGVHRQMGIKFVASGAIAGGKANRRQI